MTRQRAQKYPHKWPESIPPSRTARQKCLRCDVVRFGVPKTSTKRHSSRGSWKWCYSWTEWREEAGFEAGFSFNQFGRLADGPPPCPTRTRQLQAGAEKVHG